MPVVGRRPGRLECLAQLLAANEAKRLANPEPCSRMVEAPDAKAREEMAAVAEQRASRTTPPRTREAKPTKKP